MKVSEYLRLSREIRTNHIDLTTPCLLDERAGERQLRGRGKQVMLDYLGLENDLEDWRKGKANCCHLCSNDSYNGWCLNPKHIYVGNHTDNRLDMPKAVRQRCSDSTNSAKDGLGRSVVGLKAAATTNSIRFICLETGFVTNPGSLARYQQARGIETSKRQRLTTEEWERLKRLPEAERLMVLT